MQRLHPVFLFIHSPCLPPSQVGAYEDAWPIGNVSKVRVLVCIPCVPFPRHERAGDCTIPSGPPRIPASSRGPRSFTCSISFEMSKINEYSFACGSRQVRLATGEFYGLTVSSLLYIITIWSSFPSQTLSLSVSLFNPPHPPLFSPSLTQEPLLLSLSFAHPLFVAPPNPLQLCGCLRLRLGPALRRHVHLGPCPHTHTHTPVTCRLPLSVTLCPCRCFLP